MRGVRGADKGGGGRLLEYEKDHNSFLRALGDASLRKFTASLRPDLHVVLVPQQVVIERMALGRDFAEAHVARFNPLNEFQLVTLAGVRVLLSDDRHALHVLPPSEFRVPFDPHGRRERERERSAGEKSSPGSGCVQRAT